MRTFILSLILVPTGAFAAETLATRDAALEFLTKNVIGKSVRLEKLVKNAEGNMEFDFKRTIQYSDLVKTERGLKYAKVITINQKNYTLDNEGKRVAGKEPVITDRKLVMEIAVEQSRAAPSKLIGAQSVLSNTFGEPTGHATKMTLTLKGDKLEEQTFPAGFSDLFYKDGTYRAGTVAEFNVYSVESGKLKVVDEITDVYVNPDTLAVEGEPRTQEIINNEI